LFVWHVSERSASYRFVISQCPPSLFIVKRFIDSSIVV
jgi:hypothetical protein